LDDVETALDGAWAYPLMSRGELLGILVCGTKRDGESYAPDENEALAALAQSVGKALASLRPEHEDLRKVVYEMRDALRILAQREGVSTR
jgi:GAF domain-containing protein